MAAAILGSIIAALATSALVMTIESIEKVYSNAGRYPLKSSEKQLLINAGLNTSENINILESNLQSLPSNY